ncbi:MAG: hypothetical protein ACRD4D_01480 [Candidatus Acidiferrales bacterium]
MRRSRPRIRPKALRARDATRVDPTGHRVVFETRHLRVVEARLPKGKAVALHSHQPRLIVPLTTYRLKVTLPDGRTAVARRRPGEFKWVNYEVHSIEVLAGNVHNLEVEIKSARRKLRR